MSWNDAKLSGRYDELTLVEGKWSLRLLKICPGVQSW